MSSSFSVQLFGYSKQIRQDLPDLVTLKSLGHIGCDFESPLTANVKCGDLHHLVASDFTN